jgi:hypothetical protein
LQSDEDLPLDPFDVNLRVFAISTSYSGFTRTNRDEDHSHGECDSQRLGCAIRGDSCSLTDSARSRLFDLLLRQAQARHRDGTPNTSSVTITDDPIFYEGTRVSGYHSIATQVPFAFTTTIKGTTSLILGHELLEMLADPDLNSAEIVDKWVTRWYYVNGLPVVDFALPNGTDFCSLRTVKCIGMPQ